MRDTYWWNWNCLFLQTHVSACSIVDWYNVFLCASFSALHFKRNKLLTPKPFFCCKQKIISFNWTKVNGIKYSTRFKTHSSYCLCNEPYYLNTKCSRYSLLVLNYFNDILNKNELFSSLSSLAFNAIPLK